jgi:hypothetical protein
MEFIPIFTNENDCNLWSACYPEDKKRGKNKSIFDILINEKWSDPKYVREFLTTNSKDLFTPFWKGLTITDAAAQISDERTKLDERLFAIEYKVKGYEYISLINYFQKLHTNKASLITKNENIVKGKPTLFRPPLLRLYGIELEDGVIIVTGGTIKLKKDMIGDNFDFEIQRLNRVQEFLKQEGIINRQGLIDK